MAMPARTLRLAHRGDWRHAPENSLAALLAAVAVPGCDGLEFDVRRSADGVPILLHDETLERVQGRPDRADELRADALDAFGIPTLADVLAAIPRRTFLDIELKGEQDRTVVEVLASGRGAELRDAVISSFEPDTLERVAGLAPLWPRWLNARTLGADVIATAQELDAAAYPLSGSRSTRTTWAWPVPRTSRWRPGPSAAARRSIGSRAWAWPLCAWRPPRSTGSARRDEWRRGLRSDLSSRRQSS